MTLPQIDSFKKEKFAFDTLSASSNDSTSSDRETMSWSPNYEPEMSQPQTEQAFKFEPVSTIPYFQDSSLFIIYSRFFSQEGPRLSLRVNNSTHNNLLLGVFNKL